MTIREHQASILAQIAAWPEIWRQTDHTAPYRWRDWHADHTDLVATKARLATATEALRALVGPGSDFDESTGMVLRMSIEAAYDARAVLEALDKS